jgi:hypothetical protein
VKSAGGGIVKTFEGKLSKTSPFDVEQERCFRAVHEFKMAVGKTYTIDLDSENFSTFLRLENEDEDKLAEDQGGAGFQNSRIVFAPKMAGTYRLVVTTGDVGQIGAYRLTVREINATDKKK